MSIVSYSIHRDKMDSMPFISLTLNFFYPHGIWCLVLRYGDRYKSNSSFIIQQVLVEANICVSLFYVCVTQTIYARLAFLQYFTVEHTIKGESWILILPSNMVETNFLFKWTNWHGTNPMDDMGLLPDIQNYGLRMHRECRERFPRQRLQGNREWAIPACIACGGEENVPGIPGARTNRNFAYLVMMRKHYNRANKRCELSWLYQCTFWSPSTIMGQNISRHLIRQVQH